MARLRFFLQPMRSGPNLIACMVCAACVLFLMSAALLQIFPQNSSSAGYNDVVLTEKFFGSLSELSTRPIAVLVITSQRVPAITSHLEQLKRLRPMNGSSFPIVISQDGDQSAVTEFIRSFTSTTPYTHFIHHKERPAWTGPPKDRANRNYFYIAQHYKWALDQIFFKMNFSTAVITEEDLDIAGDFFNYFSNAHHLLYEDPTIWCISAWNDNGSPLNSDWRRVEQLYRTDFFPGLGWMLTSELWRELSPIWPSSYWDDWMRQSKIRKDRVCVRPEISRTLHNMAVAGKGTSGGMFKSNLAAIRLPDQKIDFSLVEMNKLKKPEYDRSFNMRISEAIPITLAQFMDGEFRKDPNKFSKSHSYRFVYNDPREYRIMAKKFGLMYDVRSGMERTSYCGVVTFFVEGVRVFAIHKNLDLLRPIGSYPCSEIYEEKWDLMGKYLDFSELYCTKRKWTGKCDPNDPDMINWFIRTKQLKRLKAWGEMLVF